VRSNDLRHANASPSIRSLVASVRSSVALRRRSPLLCQLATALGTALIAYLIYRTSPVFGFLEVSCACAFFFFPLRSAVVQTVWMLGCYAVAVLLAEPAGRAFEACALLTGSVVAVLCVALSLQRRAAAHAERERESRAILDAFFESSPLGVALFDREIRYVRVNDAYAAWSGRTTAEHVGRRINELRPGLGDQVDPLLRSVLETGEAMVCDENVTAGRVYRATRYPIEDATGRPALVAAVIDDITELRQAEAKLEQMLAQEQAARRELELARRQLAVRNDLLAAQASTDPLTGLANRTGLTERFGRALEKARAEQTNVGVVYIDLDGFKEVNDRHGHLAGDELLGVVARRLNVHRRANDVLARVGGDEFVVVLAGLEPAHAREWLAATAQRIQDVISAPIVLSCGRMTVHASYGTAIYPDDGATGQALVAIADAEMYRCKRAHDRERTPTAIAADRP
jgi:diguanylate cyclase (GGDEF)-like protein/PAS domain S-box-containing protein